MSTKPTITDLTTKINKCKAAITQEKRYHGYCENMGAAEDREISEMAMRISHDGARPMSERTNAGVIYDKWMDWLDQL